MKQFLKSTVVALILLGSTHASQAQGGPSSIDGPNILSGLFGRYEGNFTAVGRTLPFKSFYLTVYPNGAVYGSLTTYGLEKSASSANKGRDYAYVTGMADKKGNFEASFSYNDKYYTLQGQVNKSKKAIGVAKPYRKNNAVGALSGTLSKTSYAPSSFADAYVEVYGNGSDFYFGFYNDGSFEGYDYDLGEGFGGDYSYAKLGNNLARLTIYTDGETHTFLIYFFGDGNGLAYDVGTGKFHYLYGGGRV